MEWKLFGKNKEFLQEVNCQYDACDIAMMMYDAKKIELDFDKKEAYIIEVNQIQQDFDTYNKQIGY